MSLRGRDRAQSIQIGFILLFGALVVLFATYQAFVIPGQNAQVEANHQGTIEGQMQDLRNAIVSVSGTRAGRSVTLALGTSYPERLIALNPNPPSGSLRTVGTTTPAVNLTVANARATDTEVDDYWNGTGKSFNTGAVVYQPNYNEYQNAPVLVYENTLLYKQFRSANLSVTGQQLVDGRELSLTTLNGTYSRGSSESVTLDVTAVSASQNAVTITNRSGRNVSVQFASFRNESAWERLLRDDGEFRSQGGYVVDVTERTVPGQPFDVVGIEFQRGETYGITMAKAGLGTRIEGEDVAYLTDVDGAGATVREGQAIALTVETRDRYNNPVGGVRVDATAESGSLADRQQRTGSDGRATFEFTAPSGAGGSVPVNFSYDGRPATGFRSDTAENVSVGVTVQQTDTPGEGGAYSVSWADPDGSGDNPGAALSGCTATDCTWDVGQSGSDQLTLRGQTVQSIEGLTLDFGVNASSVGSVVPGSNTTTASGEATTTLTANGEGTVAVYVSAGGSSDRLNVTVTNVTAANPGGISGTRTPSLVPFANGQFQRLSVTVDSELPAGESVTIDLSDAQETGPVKVDYQSASFEFVSRSGNINTNANSGTTTVTVNPDTRVPAGGTIQIRASSVAVGDLRDQTGPYSVTYSRSDAGSAADSFDVAYDTGQARLDSLSATDLETGQTGQTQTVEFSPATDLASRERVTIDLSDPQSLDQVRYGSGSATVAAGSGTIEDFEAGNENDEVTAITYRAPNAGLPTSETVEIELTSVAVDDPGTAVGTYTVGYSRETADTASTTFDVVEPANFQVTIDSTTSPVTEGETLDVTATIENTGGVSDTQTVGLNVPGETNPVDSRSISLGSGDSTTRTFSWATQQGDNGTYTVEVASADDTDTSQVTVEQSDAGQTSLVSGSVSPVPGANTKIEFDLQNTGTSSVDVTAISVDSTDTSAAFVEDTDDGIEFEGAGGSLDQRITIGGASEPMDTDATIASGTTETFDLGQFRDGPGNGGRVNMRNQQVTITLTFGDGSSRQYVLNT